MSNLPVTGKSHWKDFCNVIGPCLVTPDEINYKNLKALVSRGVVGKLRKTGYILLVLGVEYPDIRGYSSIAEFIPTIVGYKELSYRNA